MPTDSSLLQKLRDLITHDGTQPFERRAALEQLERLIRGYDGPSRIATRITRSVRFGSRRRRVAIDERDRLRHFTDELTVGTCITRIASACGPRGRLPERIDFGCHSNDQPVIAVSFPTEEAPSTVEWVAAASVAMPGARVTIATHAAADERRFLVYLPGRLSDDEGTGRSDGME